MAAPKDLIVSTSPVPTTTPTPARPTRPAERATGAAGRMRRLKRVRKGRNGTTAALRKKGLQALHALQADDNSIHNVPVSSFLLFFSIFAVTNHHFVEPLVPSVSDFG